MSTATISVLGSVGLIEISGDVSSWDIHCFDLEIPTHLERIIFRIKDSAITKPLPNLLDTIKSQWNQSAGDKIKNEDNKAEALMSVSATGDDTKTEADEQTGIKVEVVESNEPTSTYSPVYPCHLLTRLHGNPNPDPLDPFRPWHYSVRPFYHSEVAAEAAKKRALYQRIHYEMYDKLQTFSRSLL
ncbi:hypothetical protein DEU56DRAFT_752225 [Suillus clintonianus]|uniref:uncharacterized protein n=1 Tax=Suillus clintonianus TaxID=1904413 RepID=UPI001B864915|nr:uncharacterized protein DEU56DRAFT_752225 [Suillus clintonianus]KAG2152970.1 hypothetical protein DEU56DRAFT_752225 [Suillus clintonianus]